MLEDLRRGRCLEIDDLHGFLVAEAERQGVDAPLSRMTYDRVAALDATRAAAGGPPRAQ
jgi:ketopantoate reductase